MVLSIHTDQAPAALGPYVQACRAGSLVFISGQLGIDMETGLLGSTPEAQMKLAMKNIDSVLAAAGCTFNDVAKTTIFLTDMDSFPSVNEIYASFFSHHLPARSCIEVTRLPKGGLVEVECTAEAPHES